MNMNDVKELKVRLTFTEDLLGSAPNNPKIHEEYIASKNPNPEKAKEEVEAIDNSEFDAEEIVKKEMDVFPRDENDAPFLYDYQIRGFFKEACSQLKNVPKTKSSEVKAFKKKIDGVIFIKERKIPLDLHGMGLGNCQRPLRASTPQGERVSLANSETAPAGTTIEFTVMCLIKSDIALVKEWLEYGIFKGLGEWRNSGKGRFTVEYID